MLVNFLGTLSFQEAIQRYCILTVFFWQPCIQIPYFVLYPAEVRQLVFSLSLILVSVAWMQFVFYLCVHNDAIFFMIDSPRMLELHLICVGQQILSLLTRTFLKKCLTALFVKWLKKLEYLQNLLWVTVSYSDIKLLSLLSYFMGIFVQVPKPLIFSQCNPVFIGISRRRLNVRPAAFFFIKCSLQSNEIQQLYSTAQDGYESTQLYTVSMVCSNFFKKKEISFQSYIANTWLIFVLKCFLYFLAISQAYTRILWIELKLRVIAYNINAVN